MKIVALTAEQIPAAAELFCAAYRRLRVRLPELPSAMNAPAVVAAALAGLTALTGDGIKTGDRKTGDGLMTGDGKTDEPMTGETALTANPSSVSPSSVSPSAVSPSPVSPSPVVPLRGLAAVQDGKLLGYLGWQLVDGFRGTARRAAYVPEYGFALAAEAARMPVIRSLYSAAAALWQAQGVQTHAISLLAHETEAREAWFWHGFGLSVVDAVRPIQEPLDLPPLAAGFTIRQATPHDADLLAEIEAEHWQHYRQPPILMTPPAPDDVNAFRSLLTAATRASAWLCLRSDGAWAGYLRAEAVLDGGAAILNSPATIGISGAYLRPAYRGLGLAAALVEQARRHYAQPISGQAALTCYAVDFESFNPPASTFWPRYFQPAVYSLIRVPESSL